MTEADRFDTTFLLTLLRESGVSSDEIRVSKLFRSYLQGFAMSIDCDIMGNTLATLNCNSGCHVLLSAHIDEIGIQVTEICDNGMLKFRKIGGINSLNLVGQEVIIPSVKGVLGVIVAQGKDNNAIPDADDCYIDICCKNIDEAKQMIRIGDFLTFSPNARIVGNNIVSKAIDDRIGVFILTQVFRHLAGKLKHINLSVAATTQEEIGLRGMAILAQQTNSAICINIDVADACQLKSNLPVMGEGCVLYRNADSNPELRQMICNVAKIENIPLQISVGRNITGGTDSSRIQLFSPKTAVTDLSVPCKYMHTHNEQCAVSDISSCINLLKAFILHLENNYSVDTPILTF